MRSLLSFLSACVLSSALVYSQAPHVDLSPADQLGEEMFAHSGATGMVMVFVHDQKTFIGGYGQTAIGSGERPTADSTVRLCSLTKIFTGDLFAKLVADKTVGLNDPLEKYAPAGVAVPMRGNQKITLLELATHTSGLPREVGWPPDGTPHFTYPDYALRWQWLPKHPPLSIPGTQAVYSNIGFDLLGDALAAAAHTSLPGLLDQRTLRPLGMFQTSFYPTAEQCQRLLRGARDEGPCTVTENTAGSSGLYSTPRDMARWLRYLISTQSSSASNAYVDPLTLRRAEGLEYAGTPNAIGMGWILLETKDNPSHIFEKTGGGAGFLTYIAVNPASHSAIFVALTEGRRHIAINMFRNSNVILMKLAGMPLMEDEGPELPHAALRHGKRLTVAAARTKARAEAHPTEKPATKHGARPEAKPAGHKEKPVKGKTAHGKAAVNRKPGGKPAGKTKGKSGSGTAKAHSTHKKK